MSRNKTNMLLVTRCSSTAVMPVRATRFKTFNINNSFQDNSFQDNSFRHSAGLDLFASSNAVIPKGGIETVETGLKLILPPNTYGRITDCSGICLSAKIMVAAGGIIDADFNHEFKVGLGKTY